MKKNIITILLCVFSLTSLCAQDSDSRSKSNAFSSLMNFSGISVTVGGDFPMTGSFPASPSERIDQFLTRMILQVQNGLVVQGQPIGQLKNIPQRGIKLKRADGSELTIDLLRYRLSGDFSQNPYLKNDDVIIFPSVNWEKNFVSIYGAVNKQQKFQFVDGDKLSTILFLAQGFDPSYSKIESIEIRRMKNDGSIGEVLVVRPDEDAPLQRGDRIRVKADENSVSDYKVMVVGEVKFPGPVAVSKNSTSFADVLNRVGGLKPDASLEFATLLRGNSTLSVMKKEILLNNTQFDDKAYFEEISQFYQNQIIADMYETTRMSSLTNEDTIFFSVDNKLRFIKHSDYANLTDLTNPESEISKSPMYDGDILIIPKKPTTVYVFGQVARTGNIPWIENKGLDYYLSQAGGLGEEAKPDIYLIQGKSKQWIKISEKSHLIEPGDFIWVSKEIKRPFSYYLQLTSTVMGIVGSVATVALLVVQLGK